MNSKVIVEKVANIQEVEQSFSSAITSLGESNKIASAFKIVIKPNLGCTKSSQSGATTDVELIDRLIKSIRLVNYSAEIKIIESNNASGKADKIFQELGYGQLEKYPNVKLVNISSDRKYYVEINGHALANLTVPETLIEMDYFISVAKLKTNINSKTTGILKNQFGCLTKASKKNFHPFLSKVLTDINSLFKADLCVIDGCPGMSGFGPVDGNPVQTDLLIIGNDPVATDAVGARIMGFKPKSIAHLKYAAKHKLGEIENYELIYTNGDSLPNFHFQFVRRSAYMLSNIGLRFQRYGVYLVNLSSLIEKVRSAMSTVGVGYVQRKVTYGYAIKNIKNWVFKQDG
jgi:uncharacterized protein (DUF362 family)